MSNSISSNRKVTDNDRAIDYVVNTVFPKHATEYGEATKGLMSQVGQVTSQALEALIVLVCMFWKQAEKGGRHKGALHYPAPNGVTVRVTREDLPRFLGGTPESLNDAKASGQTIQRLLQVLGCLYEAHGNDKAKLLEGALEVFLQAETDIAKSGSLLVSASGMLATAKAYHGKTWAAPLVKQAVADDLAKEKAKSALTGILSAAGRTSDDRANFDLPIAFHGARFFTANDLEGLKATLDAAIGRQSKIETSVTLNAAEKAFTYEQVEAPALQAVNN